MNKLLPNKLKKKKKNYQKWKFCSCCRRPWMKSVKLAKSIIQKMLKLVIFVIVAVFANVAAFNSVVLGWNQI